MRSFAANSGNSTIACIASRISAQVRADPGDQRGVVAAVAEDEVRFAERSVEVERRDGDAARARLNLRRGDDRSLSPARTQDGKSQSSNADMVFLIP
ncbi:MAG TPA: hypothetical protein VFN18_01000 [Solirubrobacterales bacterium]|nr:hypothetical protein [Solirubrobacterales bacterium]